MFAETVMSTWMYPWPSSMVSQSSWETSQARRDKSTLALNRQINVNVHCKSASRDTLTTSVICIHIPRHTMFFGGGALGVGPPHIYMLLYIKAIKVRKNYAYIGHSMQVMVFC